MKKNGKTNYVPTEINIPSLQNFQIYKLRNNSKSETFKNKKKSEIRKKLWKNNPENH